jgi:hypothetical protein
MSILTKFSLTWNNAFRRECLDMKSLRRMTDDEKISFTATKVTSKNIFSRIYIDLRLLITPLVSSNFLRIEFCYLFYSFK